MSTNNLVAELMDLENQYWQALKDNDAEAAARLTDESCIVAGAQGLARMDHEALAAMMKSAPYKLTRFEMKGEPEVRLLGDDVAIVAYKVHEEMTVDGKKIKLDATDSSTWVRRNGRWRCAMHTESIAGDPFGRDRSRAAS